MERIKKLSTRRGFNAAKCAFVKCNATRLNNVMSLINIAQYILFVLVLLDFCTYLNRFLPYSTLWVCIEIPVTLILTSFIILKKPFHKVNYVDYVPELDKEYIGNYFFITIETFLVFVFVQIFNLFFFIDKGSDFPGISLFILKLTTFFYILYVKYRIHKENKDLLKDILISPKAKIKTSYYDYINKKIEDDEPHLKLYQSFEFQVKEHFRNSLEERQITIINPKTPNNPSIVMVLESAFLANHIRNGDELKAKLIEILPNTELLIEIKRYWVDIDDELYKRI
jgi:hypothetical protein